MIILLMIIAMILSSCNSYTIADYDYLKDLILEGKEPSKSDLERYDFNKDGILNSSDYVKLANIIKAGDE